MKLKIKGKMENCENCAIGKMRQKNVPKGPKEKSTKPGYRMYIDLTSSKYTSAGGSKYWCLAVDEATHMKFSMFLKQIGNEGKVSPISQGTSTHIWC